VCAEGGMCFDASVSRMRGPDSRSILTLLRFRSFVDRFSARHFRFRPGPVRSLGPARFGLADVPRMLRTHHRIDGCNECVQWMEE